MSLDSWEAGLKRDDPSNFERPMIDMLVISHFDHGHISGLIDLFNHFDVKTIVLPFMSRDYCKILAQFGYDGDPAFDRLLDDPWSFFMDNNVKEIVIMNNS